MKRDQLEAFVVEARTEIRLIKESQDKRDVKLDETFLRIEGKFDDVMARVDRNLTTFQGVCVTCKKDHRDSHLEEAKTTQSIRKDFNDRLNSVETKVTYYSAAAGVLGLLASMMLAFFKDSISKALQALGRL